MGFFGNFQMGFFGNYRGCELMPLVLFVHVLVVVLVLVLVLEGKCWDVVDIRAKYRR